MANDSDFSGITSNNDLRDVSFVIRNLYKIGSLSASEILRETGNMMPKFRTILHAGAGQINNRGSSFSQAVESLFPPATMAAIKAGEDAGRLYDVMDQIWRTAKIQEEINKVLAGLILPVVLFFVGVVISLAFFLFLVPSVYEGLAKGVPMDYDPGLAIRAAMESNKWIMANWQVTSVGAAVAVSFISAFVMRQSTQDAISNTFVLIILKIRPIGRAYANLKFGVMAQYLQIVSLAGLDADKRIDLVMDILPEPLRFGLRAFRGDLLTKGIAEAARSEGRPDGDPRLSLIQWPAYIRLAFFQANEGSWEEPMGEFGTVMLEDGKENIKRQIALMNTLSIAVVGLVIVIPVALLYSVMGEILTMRMRML